MRDVRRHSERLVATSVPRNSTDHGHRRQSHYQHQVRRRQKYQRKDHEAGHRRRKPGKAKRQRRRKFDIVHTKYTLPIDPDYDVVISNDVLTKIRRVNISCSTGYGRGPEFAKGEFAMVAVLECFISNAYHSGVRPRHMRCSEVQ